MVLSQNSINENPKIFIAKYINCSMLRLPKSNVLRFLRVFVPSWPYFSICL